MNQPAGTFTKATEILEKPIKYQDWTEKHQCYTCKALLAINANSVIQLGYWDDYTFCIICPVCKSIGRPKEDIPWSVRNYVEDKTIKNINFHKVTTFLGKLFLVILGYVAIYSWLTKHPFFW